MKKRIVTFFAASPRDLSMQTLTVSEIADRMKPVDQRSMALPREFAKKVTRILEVRDESGETVSACRI